MTLPWRAQEGPSPSWVSLPKGLLPPLPPPRQDPFQQGERPGEAQMAINMRQMVAHRDVQKVLKTAELLPVAVTLGCNVMKKIAIGLAVGKAVYKNFRVMAGLARDWARGLHVAVGMQTIRCLALLRLPQILRAMLTLAQPAQPPIKTRAKHRQQQGLLLAAEVHIGALHHR